MRVSKSTMDKLTKLFAIIDEKGVREFSAGTTLQQIRAGVDNMGVMLSWGIETVFSHPQGEQLCKGMGFHVNGHHHKGWVVITLNFMDTYDVHYVSESGDEIVETQTDLYFDQIGEVIDRRIEWIEDYIEQS